MSICVGTNNPTPTLIGLTDRKKLRPMVVGRDKDSVYISSEECALRRVDFDGEMWAPLAGNPVIVEMGKGVTWHGTEDFTETKIKIDRGAVC